MRTLLPYTYTNVFVIVREHSPSCCWKMATPGERPPVALPPSREAISEQYGDEMDEALVGPVYLRLDDPAFRSYVQYANQTYEEEEAGDEELGLDLSAPPPES